MADYGYVPVSAAQRRSRKAVTAEHTQHMLAFAHVDSLGQDSTAGERGEIILYNSHDGTGAVKLFAGAYRFICSNGIVAGDGFASAMKHSAKGLAGFEEMLKGTVEALPSMLDTIAQLKNKQLSRDQIDNMLQRSAATRWQQLPDFVASYTPVGTYIVHTDDLLQVQRFADMQADAYTVFNRIQENIIRGNAFIARVQKETLEGGVSTNIVSSLRKARPVNSVSENIRINRELWNIATDVALA